MKVKTSAINCILRSALLFILILFSGAAFAITKITGVSVGSQSFTPTYSSSGTVTYSVTFTTGNVFFGFQQQDDLLLSWSSAPAGVTVTLVPNRGSYNSTTGAYTPGTTSSFTLQISYTTSTLPGSYSFTLTNTDNNGGGTNTATGTFTINPPTPTVSGGGTGCAGSLTLTASGGSPSGGTYNWYNSSSGGTVLATGSTYAPTVAGTYYATYTYSSVEGSTSSGNSVSFNPGAVISTVPTGPASGLYLSYPFSGNANDVSGNNNNGNLMPNNGLGPSLTTDRYNQPNNAYSFNGSNQYISTTTGEPTPGPTNFSISVWFQTSTPGGMLVGYSASKTGQGSQYDRHIYMDNSGYLYFGIYTTSTSTANVITSTSTYADGNWHHAVATCSSTSGSCLYVDGVLVASSSTMTTPETYTSVGYWRVGYNNLSGWSNLPSNPYFTGSLDDIAVYKSVLTASQVATLYGASVTSPVCAGGTLSLSVNTVSGATYSWSGPNGFSSTSQNPTVSTNATSAMAGTYTCTVTPSSGCASFISVTAIINAAPVSSFTATSSVNIGANATITYSGTYSSTSTYTWNFNGGTIVSGSGVGPYTVNWSSPGSKTVTLTVTNSSGCSSVSTQNVMVGSYGSYTFNDPITLNTTSLGISSNLTNFPALLSIQDNNLIISGACADKVYYPNGPNYDFAFYDPSTSSELYYQVESYNQTTGTLLVWVQIPTLTYASNKTIYFYYGSASPITTHNTAFYQSTWSSDYKAVYHFAETSYTGTTADATSNGHTGTANGMSASNLVTGMIGNAYSFNGSSTSISNSGINITGTFTISAWINLSVLNKDQKIMTNQSSGGSSSGGYKLGVFTTNEPETESPAIGRGSSPTPPACSSGTWYYVQGVYSGSQSSTYVNGSRYEILTTNTAPSSTNPFYIGVGEGGNQYYFNGTIDEVRVSNVAKTSDWIKAEYVNQSNPTSFATVGSTAVNTTNADSFPGALTYTWTGATSTDPSVASNWNNTTAGTTGQVPAFDGSAYLVIPAGLTNYPSLTADASLYGLTIGSGASLNLNGHTLSVGCNIYNSSSGQILYGSSTTSGITWNGSLTTQTYNGSSTSNTASLGNMTINNSAGGTITISGGPVDIYNSLTITKGNLVVGSSPAALTLKSTATQTAGVSAIPSGYSISGTVTCERYITGGNGYRAYRLISSPVYTATVSSNNVYSINYLANSMYLTGATGTSGGFDKPGNPTLYLFREDQTPSNASFTSGNFWGISTINNSPSYNYYLNSGSTTYNIPAGNGMMFFFRGNRASASLATETSTSFVTAPTATLSTSGTLTQGKVVVHSWYTPSAATIAYTGSGTTGNYPVRGFNLVGNPYPSAIDWNNFSNTTSSASIYGVNVSPTVWTFDPATKNYATYNALTGIATGNGSNIIASGQGFFVLATAASPSLTFQESAKTSAQVTGSQLLMAKRVSAMNAVQPGAYSSYMRLKLVTDSVNYSDMVIGFNPSSTNSFNPIEDSKFVAGMSNLEAISAITADSMQASAKWVPLPKDTRDQVIRLKVFGATTGQYTLKRPELNGVPSLYRIWLMDHYKKDSLDIRSNDTYIFDVDENDTASYGANRFSIVVREDPAMMVHLLNFTAVKSTSGSQVNWITENEANYTSFALQRSTDGGKSYTTIDGLPSTGQGNYAFLDRNPVNGANTYRLQITDLNGNITYSNLVTIMYGTVATLVKSGIVVYPNPARSVLNLDIGEGFKTNNGNAPNTGIDAAYNIQITNMAGIIVRTGSTNQFTWQTDVSDLMPGTYVMKVINTRTSTLAGSSTFIKL